MALPAPMGSLQLVRPCADALTTVSTGANSRASPPVHHRSRAAMVGPVPGGPGDHPYPSDGHLVPGAGQTYQWTVSHPEMVERAVPSAGRASSGPQSGVPRVPRCIVRADAGADFDEG
jgi:hypothetical protein